MMVLPIGPWGGGAATFYQITNSLLFRGGQKLYKSFTSSSTWGLSVWVRRNALGAVNPILGSAVKFNASDTLTAGSLTTTAVYRDPTAWMHIAIAGGRLWVNGIDMGATTTSAFTCSATNCLGYDGTNYLNAGIAEFAFTDGTQPSSAPGRTDSVTGSWAPGAVSATWGTNGCYLGKPWNAASLGIDYSGHGNSWTPNGFAASDVLSDSPTNVYATWNTLDNSIMLSDGNLKAIGGGTAPNVRASMWVDVASAYNGLYFEFTSVNGTGTNTEGAIGIAPQSYSIDNTNSSTLLNNVAVYAPNGNKFGRGADTAYGSTWSSGTTVAIAIRGGNVWFGLVVGGSVTWQGGGNPINGTNPAFSGLTGYWAPYMYSATSGIGGVINTGQRPFAAAPPSGFNALCTANLPATSGATSGSFTGNTNANGPCVYTGAVPATLTINGNAVIWGTHADRLATGFKLRTSSASYNSTSTNNWTATYSTPQKPTVGSNKVPSNAQGNP